MVVRGESAKFGLLLLGPQRLWATVIGSLKFEFPPNSSPDNTSGNGPKFSTWKTGLQIRLRLPTVKRWKVFCAKSTFLVGRGLDLESRRWGMVQCFESTSPHPSGKCIVGLWGSRAARNLPPEGCRRNLLGHIFSFQRTSPPSNSILPTRPKLFPVQMTKSTFKRGTLTLYRIDCKISTPPQRQIFDQPRAW